ncbi:membrane protein insertion efficiency factor YidD [Dactylosporangium sp. NPDC000244]|uniref:membrane protein insertion efficiency factor YidD n=1 Tax=Dactylosporangium sp. NPDC000244 TaxID=3154365 RepID=UPI0033241EA4
MDEAEVSPRRRWWRDWSNCDLSGCDLDFCDGCDGCDGCDCNPFMLGSLLTLMAVAAPTRPPRAATSGPGRAGMAAIRGYQRFLSPHLPFRCRQTPSCSNYGLEAVRRYGLVEGSRLTAARIKRCNPSTPRGTVDPVP